MGKFVLILTMGVGLFFSGAWALGLFDEKSAEVKTRDSYKAVAVAVTELGDDLYPAQKYRPVEASTAGQRIVLHGVMNAMEIQEVSSPVPGTVLFIGDQVDESAVLVAGSAAFLAEPYYFATVYAGSETFVKFYRRWYEGDTVKQGQMLGMVEPAETLVLVLKEMAKVAGAEAEVKAAVAGENEGQIRYKRQKLLKLNGATNEEDLGASLLTYIKLQSEAVNARSKVVVATKDKQLADTKLQQHEIRSALPYKEFTIKSIQRGIGSYLKQIDPIIMTVQNFDRLMAEAMIDEQYAARLRGKAITATIEPTILEAPMFEFHGHTLEVNSVAVSRDMKIVSGSEDGTVCVWTPYRQAADRRLEHADPVRVVACSPAGAKENLCIAGCADGSVYIWDLDKEDAKANLLPKVNGSDARITSLAISPDGEYFASGGSDGSISIRSTKDGVEKYAFVPQNGVEKSHDDAVTALTFTPQCRLISAGRDKSLRVWQLKEKGAAPDGQAMINRKNLVTQLGVSPDGQWMLFDQGHTLRMVSVEKKTFVHSLELPANATPFETLAQFSPDGSLLLTAGAPDGRLQLWRAPDAKSRGYEVRQFAPRDTQPVSCAAFSPDAGKGGKNSFAVSASGQKVYLWSVPTPKEVSEHRIENVRLTLKTQTLDPTTRQTRVGFEVDNRSDKSPQGRFEAGRPVTIVID